jgi:sister chromatid cohesion protein DCC1
MADRLILTTSIQGFVVYDESSGELQYFPASRLPLQPQARFKDLFATKQRWSFDEIQPYLADLVGGSITEQQLLLQHSRTVISKPLPGQKESVKMYSAR